MCALLFFAAGCDMQLMLENEQALLDAISTKLYFSVSYEGNNACHGNVPAPAIPYLVHEEVAVLGNAGDLYRTGFSFAGWNTKHDGSGYSFQPGDIFTMAPEPVVLYAQWDYLIGSTSPGEGTVANNKKKL